MKLSDWHQKQRRHFDESAQDYGRLYQQNNPYFDFVSRRFTAAIGVKPGLRVLELGAAGGRFTLPLLNGGCRVTAVDLSPKSLDHLRGLTKNHPQANNLALVEDDAGALANVKETDFDAVVGGHFLHHVDDIPRVLGRAFMHLKPGGLCVFLEPNPWNIQQYVAVTILPGLSWSVEKGLLKMWPAGLRQAFLDAGFGDCSYHPFGVFPPFILNHIPGAEKAENSLMRFNKLTCFFTLNLFVARKL